MPTSRATGEPRRALALLTFDPWPVSSGTTRRLDAVIRAVADVTDLTVVVVVPGLSHELPPYPIEVVRVQRDRQRWRTVVAGLRHAARLRPVTAALHDRPEVRAALVRELARCRPDVVLTHGIAGPELLRGLVPMSNLVLDADTIDPLTFRRIARDTRGLEKLLWSIDARLLPRWSRRVLGDARAVTVVSEHDRALYARLAPAARFVLVPNGVDVPAEYHAGDPNGSLLFVGALRYPPNASAVRWFAEKVLPLMAGTSLRVVGAGEAPRLPGVAAAGFVENLATEWSSASVLVVPLRSGGGTRLKVLEAMAHGLPVVSTALGMEGLDAQPGVHYLQAEAPEEFAAQCMRLREDLGLRRRLSTAGRALTEPMSWVSCTRALVDLVRDP